MKIGYRSVWDFGHAEKLRLKESVAAGKRDRPEVARRRASGQVFEIASKLSGGVFIDETWTRTDMPPLRGWAPRLHAKVPHGRWKTMTFLAALRQTKSMRHG